MEDPYQEQGDDKMGTVTTPPPVPLLGCSFSLLCCQFPGLLFPTQHQGTARASATFLKFAFAKKGRFWNRRRFQCLGHPRLFWGQPVAGCHLELLIRKSSLIDSINSESISFDIGDPKVTFILSVKDRVS